MIKALGLNLSSSSNTKKGKQRKSPAAEAHAYNPSNSGGKDQELTSNLGSN
jgi:hypothetical protein